MSAVLAQLAKLLALVVAMLDALVKGAQSLLASYPQAPLLLISILPIIAFWLLRALRASVDEKEVNDAEAG
jgi:hypothetical protein